jgi:hypothetical protein
MEAIVLLQHVMARMPSATPAETFRMAMLLAHTTQDQEPLSADALETLIDQRMRDMTLQLAVQEDQHAAIAEDLDSLASTEPCQFSVQHLWTLIRAIKVQSQLLNLYLGPQAVDTELKLVRG